MRLIVVTSSFGELVYWTSWYQILNCCHDFGVNRVWNVNGYFLFLYKIQAIKSDYCFKIQFTRNNHYCNKSVLKVENIERTTSQNEPKPTVYHPNNLQKHLLPTVDFDVCLYRDTGRLLSASKLCLLYRASNLNFKVPLYWSLVQMWQHAAWRSHCQFLSVSSVAISKLSFSLSKAAKIANA